MLNQLDLILIKLLNGSKPIICAFVKVTISDSKGTPDLQISNLALYQPRYPGSITNAGLNISFDMQSHLSRRCGP